MCPFTELSKDTQSSSQPFLHKRQHRVCISALAVTPVLPIYWPRCTPLAQLCDPDWTLPHLPPGMMLRFVALSMEGAWGALPEEDFLPGSVGG